MGRSHGRVDVVFDAGRARQRRQTLALRLFPLDARLPRVLHAEDAPRAGQRSAQRRLVVEIALDDVDAVARQRRRPLAVRLARQAAQLEPRAPQRLRDRAALMAGHAGDENRSIARHVPVCSLSVRNRPIASSASADALIMPHGFPAIIGMIKASALALDAIGLFLTERLQTGT